MTMTLEQAREVRLIRAVLSSLCRDEITVEAGNGEGQGEISFEHLTILGQENGTFAISYASEVPATRWEPSDIDVVEVGVYPTLRIAVTEALRLYATQMIDQAIEAETNHLEYEAEE